MSAHCSLGPVGNQGNADLNSEIKFKRGAVFEKERVKLHFRVFTAPVACPVLKLVLLELLSRMQTSLAAADSHQVRWWESCSVSQDPL